MMTTSSYSFREATKAGGLAHAVGPREPYAACGFLARGITVTEGRPCQKCLDALAEEAAA